MNKPTKQNGAALLIVLMIFALVSVMATEMGARLQLQVSRASNIKDNNQAYWYAMGAEQFARKSIQQVLDLNDGVVHINQPWSKEFTFPIEGGGIQARLEDMQSCFNLNGLAENSSQANGPTAAMEAFHDMLIKAEINIPPFNAETLRDSLADWLDKDSNIRTYGAEDGDYESLRFPYLAANNLMASKSELRLIHGVEQPWLNKLMPLICVIPGQDTLAINVNTLTEKRAAILAGITGLSLDNAKSLIASRPAEGWSEVQDFMAEQEISALNLDESRRKWFSVSTEYFILHAKSRYNNAAFAMTSLFKVDKAGGVAVIQREFGGAN